MAPVFPGLRCLCLLTLWGPQNSLNHSSGRLWVRKMIQIQVPDYQLGKHIRPTPSHLIPSHNCHSVFCYFVFCILLLFLICRYSKSFFLQTQCNFCFMFTPSLYIWGIIARSQCACLCCVGDQPDPVNFCPIALGSQQPCLKPYLPCLAFCNKCDRQYMGRQLPC